MLIVSYGFFCKRVFSKIFREKIRNSLEIPQKIFWRKKTISFIPSNHDKMLFRLFILGKDMDRVTAFKMPMDSIKFYVLAAMASVEPTRHLNKERQTSLGFLVVSSKGHASFFGPRYADKCIYKPDYVDLMDSDDQFKTMLRFGYGLNEMETDLIMEQYNIIKQKCIQCIQDDRVMTLQDLEEHVDFLKTIKDYTTQMYGADSVSAWVV
jgi:hypothetical protein